MIFSEYINVKFVNRSQLAAIAIISIMIFCSVTADAQDVSGDALFNRARTQFLQGKYVVARLDLTELISQFPDNPYITSAYMLLAKTYYRIGDYTNAESAAQSLKQYPASTYAEWADYMIAACRFRRGDTESAASILANLAGNTSDSSLSAYALRALRTSILPASNPDEIFALLDRLDIDRLDLERANPTVPKKDSPPNTLPDWEPGDTIKIGLLTPLTGVSAPVGNDLYKGVRTALENHRDINRTPIELIVEDTASDIITTVLKTRALINEGVIAIIGPVFSESTIAAAIEANHAGIPFISATIADEGFTDIGNSVFQINLTPKLQAFALARFAADSLVFDKTAVIATDDEWGETVLQTYTETFIQSGGDVLATGKIEAGARVYNYDSILTSIRDSAPDALAPGDSVIIYDGGNAYPDTLIIRSFPEVEGGPRYKPIDTIDCILVSALAEDVVHIAGQIKEYNINTVLLGDSGWHGDVLLRYAETIEGAMLISSEGDFSGVLGSQYFHDDHAIVDDLLDNVHSRRGYDACAVILHCLAQGARYPQTLIQSLESVRDFHGISTRITFDQHNHVNTAVDFAQIRNGELVKFDRRSLYHHDPYLTFPGPY